MRVVQNDLPHSMRAMTDAMQAPMCTRGPSVPRVKLAAQLKTEPMNLVTSVRMRSRSGTSVPLRKAITRDTPPPAAVGAQNCTYKCQSMLQAVQQNIAHSVRSSHLRMLNPTLL